MMPAVSHPAVPPPTMQIDRTGLTMVYCSQPNRRQLQLPRTVLLNDRNIARRAADVDGIFPGAQ
jgi:hypothetical protein